MLLKYNHIYKFIAKNKDFNQNIYISTYHYKVMKNKIIKYALGLGLAAVIGFAGGATYKQRTTNVIPDVGIVQAGYIPPNKLKILLGDQDSNGEPETIVRIGGVEHLLRDVDGKAVLSRYRVWSGFIPIGDGKSKIFPYEIQHLE